MVAMSAKPPAKPKAKPAADDPTVMVGSRVPRRIKELLEEIAKQNRRSLATEVLIAIEERLTALGRWPEDR